MGGGHDDSHGSHGEAAEPIIEVGGTVDKVLKAICLFVVMLLAGWGMMMTQPIALATHGEGASHEKAPNIPANLGGEEGGASHGAPAVESHGGAAGSEGEVMTGPPAGSHGAAGETMTGPPAGTQGEGDAMSGPPATEHH